MIERNFNFDQFVEMVCGDFYNLDIHWMRSCDFIPDYCLHNGFIGKLENFEKDFSYVCKKIGVTKNEVPHCNQTNHDDYFNYYNSYTYKLVVDTHFADFDFFNYDY